jgi:hypothetical protein
LKQLFGNHHVIKRNKQSNIKRQNTAVLSAASPKPAKTPDVSNHRISIVTGDGHISTPGWHRRRTGKPLYFLGFRHRNGKLRHDFAISATGTA